MIGGIFETIGKTLGVGKEKYFLELDDAAEDSVKNIKQAAKTAVETAKEVSSDVVDKAQDLVDNATDKAQTSTQQATDKAAAAADKVEQKAKAIAPDSKATAKKPAKGKKGAQESAPAAKDSQPVEKAAPAPTAPSPEDLIVAAIAATSQGKTLDNQGNVVEAAKTFATDYLETPSRVSRRRPGPSLSPFRGMAKDVNPRLKS